MSLASSVPLGGCHQGPKKNGASTARLAADERAEAAQRRRPARARRPRAGRASARTPRPTRRPAGRCRAGRGSSRRSSRARRSRGWRAATGSGSRSRRRAGGSRAAGRTPAMNGRSTVLVGALGDVVLDLEAALVDRVRALAEAEVALAGRRHERDAGAERRPRSSPPCTAASTATTPSAAGAMRTLSVRPAGSLVCDGGDVRVSLAVRLRSRAWRETSRPGCGSRACRPVPTPVPAYSSSGACPAGPSKPRRHGSASIVARSAPASTTAALALAGPATLAIASTITAHLTSHPPTARCYPLRSGIIRAIRSPRYEGGSMVTKS